MRNEKIAAIGKTVLMKLTAYPKHKVVGSILFEDGVLKLLHETMSRYTHRI